MSIRAYNVSRHHKDAFPLGSKGSSSAINPDAMNNTPEIYIGTDDVRFAYKAMIGAYNFKCAWLSLRTSSVDRMRMQTHHNTENAIRAGYERVACPPVPRRE